ncbi:MAG: hypothetical protein GY725_16875 [bacterium]|nr:hypothetical protein [bacterium]
MTIKPFAIFLAPLALLALTVSAGPIGGVGPGEDELPATMQDIFAQLHILLPLAVQDDALTRPENRKRVEAALARLVDRSDALAVHGSLRDPGARYLGAVLGREAARSLEDVRAGSSESASFFVRHLTGVCVSCHSRMSSDDSSLARGFANNESFKSMEPFERARLHLATRRFDDALDSYEKGLDQWSSRLLPWGPLVDYLAVAVRVRQVPKRALATLQKLASRSFSQVVDDDIHAWIADLRALEGESPAFEIARIRAQLRQLSEAKRRVADRRLLVRYLAVSAGLHAALEEERIGPEKLAEAYLLLGEAELEIARFAWASAAFQYLELAIQTARDPVIARRSFNLYEQEIVFGYSGSGGTHIPPDIRQHLEELRNLAFPPADLEPISD